ncbi:MAG TPA: hypothetical protein IGR64_17390, partial [Leptolyngbyaceae cyanobacterium M65_K2018_010]|nr:hypothetical protein [Leptolyngbyaceae cyanobacterium M65_K2018_010]
MSNSTSVVEELLNAIPQLRPRLYFKTSLTALSHAMEDHVLAGAGGSLVIASFQQERFYLQEANRYLRIAELSDHLYVLSAQGTSFTSRSDNYETIAFAPDDALVHEWHLVVISPDYQACLICRERTSPEQLDGPSLDQTRRFEGIWTQDRYVTQRSAEILLHRIETYRPDIEAKIAIAKQHYLTPLATPSERLDGSGGPDPFTQRLITYLQAGQYKLLKAYQEQEAILSSMVEGVVAVDNTDRLITLNKAGSRLLMVNPETVKGQSIQEIIRNKDLQRFLQQTRAA